MSYTQNISPDSLRQWMAQKKDLAFIEAQLNSLGLDAIAIQEQLAAYKKIQHEKRQTTGFIWMGIGALLGFISCLLSILNPVPELYYWILYGLTSVAITFIFIGLYFVFE